MALPVSARITAMGGMQIAVKDDDPVFAAANPGALNPSMGGRLSFNHNFYLAGIQHGLFFLCPRHTQMGIHRTGGNSIHKIRGYQTGRRTGKYHRQR